MDGNLETREGWSGSCAAKSWLRPLDAGCCCSRSLRSFSAVAKGHTYASRLRLAGIVNPDVEGAGAVAGTNREDGGANMEEVDGCAGPNSEAGALTAGALTAGAFAVTAGVAGAGVAGVAGAAGAAGAGAAGVAGAAGACPKDGKTEVGLKGVNPVKAGAFAVTAGAGALTDGAGALTDGAALACCVAPTAGTTTNFTTGKSTLSTEHNTTRVSEPSESLQKYLPLE